MWGISEEDWNKYLNKHTEEDSRKADGLLRIAQMMLSYCEVLRGERLDVTGLGEWQILCQNLEMIMGIKILDKEIYDQLNAKRLHNGI